MTHAILKKSIPLTFAGENYAISVERSKYAIGDRTAILLQCDNGEPFAVVSVNLPDERPSDEDCFFVDDNNCPWAPDWLWVNKIAEPTGKIGYSGFCAYPEFRLVTEVKK